MSTQGPITRYRLTEPGTEQPAQVVLHRLPTYQVATRGRSDRHHRHDFHQLLYFAQPGTHHVDFREYRYQAHTVGFIPAGAVHRFDATSSGPGVTVNVPVERLSEDTVIATARVLVGRESALAVLPDKWQAKVPQLFSILEIPIAEAQPNAALDALLATLLAIIVDALGRDLDSGFAPLAVRFLEALERSLGERRSVTELASELGVSTRTLHAATKASFGTSPGKLIHERQILEAKRLLAHSGLTVAEVGYAAGFEDPGYFSRFFTKHEGCAPSRFRQKYRLTAEPSLRRGATSR